MNIDKILEEMQIQVYTYRQKNNGENPVLVISGKFYEKLRAPSMELNGTRIKHDEKYKLLGCSFMVFYSLADNEFIVGKGFKVNE